MSIAESQYEKAAARMTELEATYGLDSDNTLGEEARLAIMCRGDVAAASGIRKEFGSRYLRMLAEYGDPFAFRKPKQ